MGLHNATLSSSFEPGRVFQARPLPEADDCSQLPHTDDETEQSRSRYLRSLSFLVSA